MKNIKTYGFGVVAQGFHNYLVNNNEENRLHTVIIKNAIKSRKKINAIIETTNDKTIRDKDVDVVLELISSADEAYGIVAENLEIGKKVISANKKLIAENLQGLIDIEKENNANFLYEGAVCGSIPIIRVLNDFYANEPVQEIKGIFNGSSNYILTQLFNNSISYDEALQQAQKLGFAEADPTSDVEGFDALYKLIIITAHAFGKVVKPEEVLTIGIDKISKTDIDFAKQNGLKIKLVAKTVLENGKLSLTVLPTLVNNNNELFNVENEYNAVLIKSENIGEQFYKGKGAGSLPTGAVVYSDLRAIDNGYKYSYKKLKESNVAVSQDKEVTVLVTAENVVSIRQIATNRIYPVNEQGNQFITQISLKDLKKRELIIKSKNISILVIEETLLIEKLISNTSKKVCTTKFKEYA